MTTDSNSLQDILQCMGFDQSGLGKIECVFEL